jgi:hypothetical protein
MTDNGGPEATDRCKWHNETLVLVQERDPITQVPTDRHATCLSCAAEDIFLDLPPTQALAS